MKHFISKDKYINAVVSNVVGLPDTSVCPFTISMFAKAFNISRTTAAKRISQNKEIIEISRPVVVEVVESKEEEYSTDEVKDLSKSKK